MAHHGGILSFRARGAYSVLGVGLVDELAGLALLTVFGTVVIRVRVGGYELSSDARFTGGFSVKSLVRVAGADRTSR